MVSLKKKAEIKRSIITDQQRLIEIVFSIMGLTDKDKTLQIPNACMHVNLNFLFVLKCDILKSNLRMSRGVQRRMKDYIQGVQSTESPLVG